MNNPTQQQPETTAIEDGKNTSNIPPSVPYSPHLTSTDASRFAAIRRVAAFVTIISAVLFALISVLAIWQVFGQNTGDVVWRFASSLGVIGFASLIVNVVARSMEERTGSPK